MIIRVRLRRNRIEAVPVPDDCTVSRLCGQLGALGLQLGESRLSDGRLSDVGDVADVIFVAIFDDVPSSYHVHVFVDASNVPLRMAGGCNRRVALVQEPAELRRRRRVG